MDVFMCDCCKRLLRKGTNRFKVEMPSASLEVCDTCHEAIAETVRVLTKPFPEKPEAP